MVKPKEVLVIFYVIEDSHNYIGNSNNNRNKDNDSCSSLSRDNVKLWSKVNPIGKRMGIVKIVAYLVLLKR